MSCSASCCPGPCSSSTASCSAGPRRQACSTASWAGTAGFTVALGCWLARGRAPGLQAGILGAGAIFALAVGVCLLPLSLIGVFFVVGVLGFSPFLMAWSYYRCARDAWRLRSANAVLPALLGRGEAG